MEVEGEENKDYLQVNQISGAGQDKNSEPGNYERHHKSGIYKNFLHGIASKHHFNPYTEMIK